MTVEGYSIVMVTAPSVQVAESVVTQVVTERLAACGNIVPGVTSIYSWQGEVHRDAEVLILFKTTAASAQRLIDRVVTLHPYEVPEAVVLPVVAGSGPYLAWVAANAVG